MLDPNASVQLQEDDLTKVKFKDQAILEKKKSIVLKPSRVSQLHVHHKWEHIENRNMHNYEQNTSNRSN